MSASRFEHRQGGRAGMLSVAQLVEEGGEKKGEGVSLFFSFFSLVFFIERLSAAERRSLWGSACTRVRKAKQV